MSILITASENSFFHSTFFGRPISNHSSAGDVILAYSNIQFIHTKANEKSCLTPYLYMIDIEPVSLGISITLLAAFILPLYIVSKKVRSTEKRLLNKQLDFALLHQIQLNHFDTWRRKYFIGIDQNNKYLIYNSDMESESPRLIDLKKINHVKLIEKSRSLGRGREKYTVMDSIGLECYTDIESFYLEFYDGDKFSDLLGESVFASKWQKLLKNAIVSEKVIH